MLKPYCRTIVVFVDGLANRWKSIDEFDFENMGYNSSNLQSRNCILSFKSYLLFDKFMYSKSSYQALPLAAGCFIQYLLADLDWCFRKPTNMPETVYIDHWCSAIHE